MLQEQMTGSLATEEVALPTFGELDRREFLKAVGGGIVVLVTMGGAGGSIAEAQGYPEDFNAYVRIGKDGRVTVFSGKIEMGQGVVTSLAQMAAEDLDVSLERIDMIMGDTDLVPYDRGTWGSMSTRFFGPAVRAAAAKAREVLLDLASQRLEAPIDRLEVKDGVITSLEDRSQFVTYAELAGGEPITHTVDREAVLKSVREFKTMGVPTKRLDAHDKVTGKAKYAGDIQLPDMLYARHLRPPAHSSVLQSVDISKAEEVPGVVIVNQDEIVAALHEDPEQAERALGLIGADWQTPEPHVDETTIWDYLRRKDPGGEPDDVRGSVETGAGQSEKRFSNTYQAGYWAHAPIETHTATASLKDGRITVWSSTQSPFGNKAAVAEALGIPEEKVRVITPYVGGGFGGKSPAYQAIEAALLTRIVGRPVQVAYTRAEEFFFDTFQPAAFIEIDSGLDGEGGISLWDYHVYFAGDRGAEQLYDVPNSQIVVHSRGWRAPGVHPFATGAWRAPGANINIFAKESQIDVMAAAAGVDPIEFRLRNSSDKRLRSVLEAVAEAYGWEPQPGPSGRGLGVACGIDAGSYVAHIAEVVVDRTSGEVQVKRVVCAQDIGIVVNPEGAKMQMEGCITMGLGYAFSENLRFRGGEILDKNFDTYEIPRFSWVPKIDTVLVENDDLDPQGGGEPAIIAMGGAVANAIFDATGPRLFQLPMTPVRVLEALAANNG
jgi:isoquinoline 1-oxidoreductase